jgi:hypothetical protein
MRLENQNDEESITAPATWTHGRPALKLMLRRSKIGYLRLREHRWRSGVAEPNSTAGTCLKQETTMIIIKLFELVRSVLDDTHELQRVMRDRYPRLGE